MNKLKKWFEKYNYVYINEKESFYIEKVSWFMLLPEILIFYDFSKDRFEAISFGWLFWSINLGRWNEE